MIVQNPKGVNEYKGVSQVYSQKEQNNIADGANKSIGIINKIESDEIEVFSKTPKEELLDKKNQDIKHKMDGFFEQEIGGSTDDFRNHNSNSVNARTTYSYDIQESNFEIVKRVLEQINESSGFKVKYLSLKNKRNNLLIASISYFKKRYYLIDAGNKRIGILKFMGTNKDILEYEQHELNIILFHLEENYNYNWSKALKKKTLDRYKVKILGSLNHSRDLDFEESVKSLEKRILEKIVNDET